eukprot:372692-Pelagomonas_calceolata.AAC.3
MSDGRRGLQAVAWGAEQNSGRHATACAQNAVSLLRPRQQTASLSLRLSLRGCSHFYIPPPPHIDLTDHSRVGEDRIRERRRFKRRSSQGGRIERQESVRQRSSGGGDSNRQEGGGPVPSDKEEHDGAARQPQGPGPMGGPNNPWPKISLLQLGKGESFSGRWGRLHGVCPLDRNLGSSCLKHSS